MYNARANMQQRRASGDKQQRSDSVSKEQRCTHQVTRRQLLHHLTLRFSGRSRHVNWQCRPLRCPDCLVCYCCC